MLESCIAVGMTTILTNTVEMLFSWTSDGKVPDRQEQRPASLFVDCSNGMDRQISAQAEQAMDDFMRRVEGCPTVLMVLRILDYEARHNRNIKAAPTSRSVHTPPLGSIYWETCFTDGTRRRKISIPSLKTGPRNWPTSWKESMSKRRGILKKIDNQRNHILRLADGLMALIGPKFVRGNFMAMIDSVLLANRPNGLAAKRNDDPRHRGGRERNAKETRGSFFGVHRFRVGLPGPPSFVEEREQAGRPVAFIRRIH